MIQRQIYNILFEEYGSQGWWPIINPKTFLCEYGTCAPRNQEDQFEIIVGAILTQNTAWYPNVVKALLQLRIGRLLTKKELEALNEADESNESEMIQKEITQNNCLTINAIHIIKKELLASYIRPAGYYNQKAERLKTITAFLMAHPLGTLQHMEAENLRNLFLTVKGIGPETADSIVLYAFKKQVFVIDSYTKRIMARIGICNKDISYNELQINIMNAIEKDCEVYSEYHALMVEHAKRFCKTKPLCEFCPLKNICKKRIYCSIS